MKEWKKCGRKKMRADYLVIAENEELADGLYAGMIEREEFEDEDVVRGDLRATRFHRSSFF